MQDVYEAMESGIDKNEAKLNNISFGFCLINQPQGIDCTYCLHFSDCDITYFPIGTQQANGLCGAFIEA